MTKPSPTPLGVIAGNRSLPLFLARQIKAQDGRRVVAAAFHGETDPAMESLADETVWLRVGQLGKLIEAFKSRGVRECVMAGQIAPSHLFHLRPDWRALRLLMRLRQKNAHTLFGGIAEEMEKDGLRLIEATPWLGPLMPGTDYRHGGPLTQEQQADVEFGRRIAKEISRLDIGQCVVVKNGAVLAVEGWEGTDACLLRGGGLAGRSGKAVAVKVAKASHDMRFDIPCVGPKTIETCREGNIQILAFEAGKTLLLDREELEKKAKKYRVQLIAVP